MTQLAKEPDHTHLKVLVMKGIHPMHRRVVAVRKPMIGRYIAFSTKVAKEQVTRYLDRCDPREV